MAVTVELPPAMAKEAQDYVLSRGTTIEQFLFDRLKEELARRARAKDAMSTLDAIAKRVGARLSGEPYVFNRADAYEPERTYA